MYRRWNGYGEKRYKGKRWLAHRLAYFLEYGEDPGDRCVCHACDNPSCVEPTHLFLGTHDDNVQDRNRKGRQAMWPNHGRAKLTYRQAAEIKGRLLLGEKKSVLAREFGITGMAILDMERGRSWKGVPALV